MKTKYTANIVIVAAIVLCTAFNAEAVPNPGGIVWNGAPRTFITSLYIGVLGRQPETQAVVTDWARQVNETATSRYRVFWAFINSPEYQQSSWAKQEREYNVYRKYVIQGDFFTYSVSKGPLGADYYPQSGPYTFGVAMALRNYYNTFAHNHPQDNPQRGPRRVVATPNRTVLNAGTGPYHEFASLCRIGWASALSRYSVGPADDSIIDHLRFAGEHMEMANRTTFDPIRAWPQWQVRKNRLRDQATRLDSSNGSSRSSLANELKADWTGYADELAKQVIASRLKHLPTCDSHYARIGYQLCYGQQALQIAAVAEQDGNRPLMQRSLADGLDRLQGAHRELMELPRVKLATGACVDLSPVERMVALISRTRPLQASVAAANSAFDETVRILTGARQAVESCSGDLAGTWIGSGGGGGFIIRFEQSGDQYLGRFIMVRPDMQKKDYQQGQVYMKLRKEGARDYVGTWDSSVWGRRKMEQIKIVVSGNHMREETSGGFKTTMSRVPDDMVRQIRLVGNPGMENFYLRGYSDHDITFKPPECGR